MPFGTRAKRLIATHQGRYLAIGCICALANNIIMVAGDRARQNYLTMALVSFVIVTPLAYALHTRFTFVSPFSVGRLLRYASGAALAFPMFLALMAIFCSLMKLPVVIAVPMTTVLLFVWNYISAHLAIVGRLRRH